MKVLHLFSGSGSMDQAFKDRGHKVWRMDINPQYKPDAVADVMDIEKIPDGFDVIMGGFPCESFSVASISKHWRIINGRHVPITEQAEKAVKLVQHTRKLVDEARPVFEVFENPVDKARKLWPDWLAGTLWLCQYGDERAKPTDLFGHIPPSFQFRRCHNGAKDHAEAHRGARTGTQGRTGAFERSKMPYQLSFELCVAMEKDFEAVRLGDLKPIHNCGQECLAG